MTTSSDEKKGLNVPPLRFPEFKGEWALTSLSELCGSFEYGLNEPAVSFDGLHKYLRITDIDESTSAFKDDSITSPAGFDDLYKMKENDIVFTRTGASVGKTYLYDKKDGCLYYAGFLIRANIRKGNPYFVFSETKRNKFKNWVKLMSARSGQPGINSKEYASYSFFAPSQEEQDKISLVFKLVDQRINVQRKIIKERMTLEKALCSTLKTASKEKLEELCTCVSSTLQESQTNEYGQYPVYGANGLVGYRDDFQFERPGVAIIKDGAGVGRVYSISDDKYSILGTMSLLLPQKNCSLSFLYFALKNLSFGKYIVGSGIPHIYFKNYQKAAVPSQNKKTTTIASMVEINKKYVSVSKMTLLSLENEKAFLLANLFC